MAKIGVFDSGVGGLAVAEALGRALPDEEIVFVHDRENMPYGDKPPAVVLGLVIPKLERLVAQGCEVIVVACNTVTTNHIEALRDRLPVRVVGIEPMVKPAATTTKTGVIAVCATPATLASERYAWLKQQYAAGVRILEPDCSRWAYMIERDEVSEGRLREQIDEICKAGADVIVLGCTHYHWIEEDLQRLAAGRAVVIQPEQAVVAQVRRVLAQARATRGL